MQSIYVRLGPFPAPSLAPFRHVLNGEFRGLVAGLGNGGWMSRGWLGGRWGIPLLDDRHLGVMRIAAEEAEGGGAEGEMLGLDDGEADPAACEHAAELAVRKERDAALQRAQMGNEPVSAGGDLPGGFAIRAAIAKEVPARPGDADVHGALAFVVAVVPLGEVGLDLRGLAQAAELTGAAGALQWAGQHMIKADAAEMRGP